MLMGKVNFATRKANENAGFPAIILVKWIEFYISYIVVKEEDNSTSPPQLCYRDGWIQ
jgi:hypothetical protein